MGLLVAKSRNNGNGHGVLKELDSLRNIGSIPSSVPDRMNLSPQVLAGMSPMLTRLALKEMEGDGLDLTSKTMKRPRRTWD